MFSNTTGKVLETELETEVVPTCKTGLAASRKSNWLNSYLPPQRVHWALRESLVLS